MDNVDVLVVGAGATGLMLANELAIAGVSVVVIDREAGRLRHSKALALQPRTAEVFDLRGLIDGARDRSLASVNGHFGGLPVPLAYEGWSTRYPYMVAITQSETEALLEERAAANGVAVRREHELTVLAQDEEGVTATMRTPQGEQRVCGRYLVGCDGGRSVVRKLLGVNFPGTPAVRYSVAADVLLQETGAELTNQWGALAKMFGQRNASGQSVALLPLGEPNFYRLSYTDPSISAETRDIPVPKERLEEVLQSQYGETARIAEVQWVSSFGDASRQAERYRVERVLLAGDAAHIHLPAAWAGPEPRRAGRDEPGLEAGRRREGLGARRAPGHLRVRAASGCRAGAGEYPRPEPVLLPRRGRAHGSHARTVQHADGLARRQPPPRRAGFRSRCPLPDGGRAARPPRCPPP